MILKFFFKKNAIHSIYIGIKIRMYDSTFYSKKYKCPLMFLFYLEIIDPTFIYFLLKKWMLHSSLAYMQLNQISPTVNGPWFLYTSISILTIDFLLWLHGSLLLVRPLPFQLIKMEISEFTNQRLPSVHTSFTHLSISTTYKASYS